VYAREVGARGSEGCEWGEGVVVGEDGGAVRGVPRRDEARLGEKGGGGCHDRFVR
jgi:hypothetical protein